MNERSVYFVTTPFSPEELNGKSVRFLDIISDDASYSGKGTFNAYPLVTGKAKVDIVSDTVRYGDIFSYSAIHLTQDVAERISKDQTGECDYLIQ